MPNHSGSYQNCSGLSPYLHLAEAPRKIGRSTSLPQSRGSGSLADSVVGCGSGTACSSDGASSHDASRENGESTSTLALGDAEGGLPWMPGNFSVQVSINWDREPKNWGRVPAISILGVPRLNADYEL